MSPGQLALAEAIRQLGVEEDPPGSNHTPFGVWIGTNGKAWCATFMSWAFHSLGVELCKGFHGPGVVPGKGCAWVPTIEAWLKARDWWLPASVTPQPGDLVLYDWGLDGAPDHIGIVESAGGGKISAIEGNSHDRVERMTRDTYHVAGYGRIGG